MTLTHRILLAMVLGIGIGIVFNLALSLPLRGTAAAHWLDLLLIDGLLDIVGQIFVRSLQLLVIPLVFVSLVCGSAALGNHARMGNLALKTVAMYLLTTALAITLALSAALLVKPGSSIELDTELTYEAAEAPPLKDTIIGIFPRNPVEAMAEGNMLQVIVFALLFGIALSRSGDTTRSILDFFNGLNAVVMKMVLLLMQLAPFGVFCLLVKLFASIGFEGMRALATYFFTVLAVLLLHGLGVYSLLLKLLTRLNPVIFLRKLGPVMAFGFSTASSNATIPITLRTVEHELGTDNKVASFSVPLGATINMDGTAIMQGVATVFIAQAYGLDIGLTGYLLVVLTATLASVGTAGVPGVGLITLAMVLQQVGLPVEGIALIIGIDRLLDMVRTAVNVTGDAMVTTVVANSENLLDREQFTRD